MLFVLERATSHLLLEPDWDSILTICDCIRQGDITYVYLCTLLYSLCAILYADQNISTLTISVCLVQVSLRVNLVRYANVEVVVYTS